MTGTDEILFERRGALAVATLNRPDALNALTLGMIRQLAPRLRDWADDPAVAAVLVTGAGDRAFCAGGDLRAFWDLRHGDRLEAGVFFREEYRLNRQVFTFPKPYVAVIDGIVMGGGVGLSVHGRHRVASERTRFAMPETGIGLFPDVGASYVLPRLPGELGLYLGLTGRRLDAADCLYCGIATHYVAAAGLPALESALAEIAVGETADAAVAEILDRASSDPGPSALAEDRDAIDRCFAQDSVEDIVAALEAEGTNWARHTLEGLQACSPTSLKLTFRQIRKGSGMDFDAALAMEFRLSQACLAGHDFLEGIRAVV
ncbi:MAG: enoyl-CoA hydratase/isomerase family protein, partial [Kiloniellales bacterium]|nr:enoyl-CoA hydratase/isomerase family protein [Kiloniellales bacterium]